MYPFCDIPGASIQTFFHTVPHVLLTIYQIGGVAITITAADRIQIPLRLVLSPCSVTLGPYKWQGAALPVNSLCRTPSFLPLHSFYPILPPFYGPPPFARSFVAPLAPLFATL